MSTTTVNTSSNVFSYVTDISSVQSNTCSFTNQSSSTGNSIVISNSNAGNIIVGTKGDMNTSCIIANNQDSMVTNIMESIAQQTAKTNQSIISLQISTEINSSAVYESVNNIVSQVQSNTCASNQSTLTSNNTVVVEGSTVGDVVLTSEGSLNGSCTQYNVGKLALNSGTSVAHDQAASITNILVTIIIVIGIVVIVIVIGVIGLMAFGKLGAKKPGAGAEMDELNDLSGSDTGSEAGLESGLGSGSESGAFTAIESAAEMGI